ncbi:MAG: alpha/beta hydrolase [Erysipelotrichaceae bacterium]|nr:alpha/beta hydrolase [Erysipelotrichaceae bacterium]
MNYKEYGKENSETVILLHGGGMNWWNYRREAELLQSDYHVILPVLDGHAGSDHPFTSIEDNAAEIISFIDENLGSSVLLIGGLSLGAQILTEMLSQCNDICTHALIESAAVIPSGLTNALVGPAFGSSYGLIKSRSFAKLQFASLHLDPDLFEDYYRDTCAITKPDMIAFMKANTSYSLKEPFAGCTADVHVYIGGKENREIRQSAKRIHAALAGSTLTVLPGLYHGEFSFNHPDDYVKTVKEIIQK